MDAQIKNQGQQADKPTAATADNDTANQVEELANANAQKSMQIDPQALEQLASNRARDSHQAREALGLNSVEPDIEKEKAKLDAVNESKRSAWLSKASTTETAKTQASDNKVTSDEIFTATEAEIKPVVPPEIESQYLRVGDKFYHPKTPDMLAFEDKGNKLETKSNSENIASSMVRIAESRGWDEIKVTGSETFRKEVWLEAAARGMHVKGYSPSEQDKAELLKRDKDADLNKVEKGASNFRAGEKPEQSTALPADTTDTPSKRMAQAFANENPVDAVKQFPELAGVAAISAAIDKKAQADGLTPAQRATVNARVRQNVVNSIERGETPEVKIKDAIELKNEPKEEKEYTR